MGGYRFRLDDLEASMKHRNCYTYYLRNFKGFLVPVTLNVLDWDSATFCFSIRIQKTSDHLACVSLRILIRILLQLLILVEIRDNGVGQ